MKCSVRNRAAQTRSPAGVVGRRKAQAAPLHADGRPRRARSGLAAAHAVNPSQALGLRKPPAAGAFRCTPDEEGTHAWETQWIRGYAHVRGLPLCW